MTNGKSHKYIVRLRDKKGNSLFIARLGETTNIDEAFEYNNFNAATHAAHTALGYNNKAFWPSERKQNLKLREERQGWTYNIYEV